LVFTDKLPRLLRAACQPDRVVSAISSSRAPCITGGSAAYLSRL